MNQQMSSSHWSRLKAMIKQDLAGVTDADMVACDARRDKLIEKLQEIYGISFDEAEGALRYYEERLAVSHDSNRACAIS
jgi:uncharacterized protein YjbJ (UPF0337 family)